MLLVLRKRIEDMVEKNKGPQIEAETWFSLALASAIIVMCLFFVAALWIFDAPANDTQRRTQAFTPFGAALIAFVTFCTVAWRGALNTRQLEYQASQLSHQSDQIAQMRRQNDFKEDENLAKLMIDGAKLLGASEQSHVLAGVAALQAVVAAPKPSFSLEAMSILVDLIESTHAKDDDEKVFDAACAAVNRGASLGIETDRVLRLDFAKHPPRSKIIEGVRFVYYRNAMFYGDDLGRIAHKARARFDRCTIEGAEIIGNRMFANCKFEECVIKEATMSFLNRNEFEACNFSNARIPATNFTESSVNEILGTLRNRENWYWADQPIQSDRAGLVELFLDARRPL